MPIYTNDPDEADREWEAEYGDDARVSYENNVEHCHVCTVNEADFGWDFLGDTNWANKHGGVDTIDICKSCRDMMKAGMIFLNGKGEPVRLISDPDEWEQEAGYELGEL